MNPASARAHGRRVDRSREFRIGGDSASVRTGEGPNGGVLCSTALFLIVGRSYTVGRSPPLNTAVQYTYSRRGATTFPSSTSI